jgi:site-specific recombinase XerD
VTPTALVVPRQAESDQHLIELWLHGRSRHTQRAYRVDARRFLEAVQKPLHHVTLGDLQQFASRLVESGLEPTSVYRTMSAIKSLFAFGHRLGYLPFDVARPLTAADDVGRASCPVFSPQQATTSRRSTHWRRCGLGRA